jgi:hypothetical protein
MDEAIEQDIAEGWNPYPYRASFVDADWPGLADEIAPRDRRGPCRGALLRGRQPSHR